MSAFTTSSKYKIFYVESKLDTNPENYAVVDPYGIILKNHPVLQGQPYSYSSLPNQNLILDNWVKFYYKTEYDGDFKEILIKDNVPFDIDKIYIKILPGIPPNYLKKFTIYFKANVDGNQYTFNHEITINVEKNGIEATYDSNKPFNDYEGDILIHPNPKNYFPYWYISSSYPYLVELSSPTIGETGMTGLNNSGFASIYYNPKGEKYYFNFFGVKYRVKTNSVQDISGDQFTRMTFCISDGLGADYKTDGWLYVHEILTKDVSGETPPTDPPTSVEKLKYYYNELNNEIIINSKAAEGLTKMDSNFSLINNRYWEKLVDYGNPQTYVISPSINIQDIIVSNSQALYCFIGNNANNEYWEDNTKKFKYNRYSHKPYKIYMLVDRGEADANGRYKAKISKAYIYFSETKVDDNIGTFKIPNSQIGDNLTLKGTALIKINTFDLSKTWEDVRLNLNVKRSGSNDWNVIKSSKVDLSTHINGEVNWEVSFDITNNYNTEDRFGMSVSVNAGANNVEAGIEVLAYDFALGSKVYSSILSPAYFNNSNLFIQDMDCHPDLNNIDDSRTNDNIYELEYSTNMLIPRNLKQVLDRTELPSDVNNYLYSFTGVKNSRFDGSYIYSQNYNEYSDNDRNTYGRTPAIEVKRAYFAYYNALHNLYPLVNNKILFDIKYMVGPQGDISSPIMDDISNLNLLNTFSNDLISDEVKIYADTSKHSEFKELNKSFFIDSLGKKPYPIFYSQNSATGFSKVIDLWGLKESLGEQTFKDFSFIAEGEEISSSELQSFEDTLSPNNARTLDVDYNGVPVVSPPPYIPYDPGNNGLVILPTDKETHVPNGIGMPLSNNYKFQFEHTFATTYINDIKYQTSTKRKRWLFWNKTVVTNGTFEDVGLFELWVEGKGLSNDNSYNNTGLVDKTYKLKNINVSMNVHYLSTSAPNGYYINTFDVTNNLVIINSKENGQSILLKFNNDLIEGLIKGKGHSIKTVDKGGTLSLITWTIKGEVDDSIVQGSSFQIKVRGELREMEPMANQNPQNKFHPISSLFNGGPAPTNTIFRLVGDKKDESRSIEILKEGDPNTKFWDFQKEGNDIKYNVLCFKVKNANDAFGKGMKQLDIKYQPSASNLFQNGMEPDFISFPKIEDSWEPKVGDQIRFNNDEELTYDIKIVEGPKTLTNNTNELRITLDRDVKPTTDLNMFLIRRWKEEKGNLIINSKFPYLPSPENNSTQGFIFPEYLSDEINSNPDKILKDLTEKGIIS